MESIPRYARSEGFSETDSSSESASSEVASDEASLADAPGSIHTLADLAPIFSSMLSLMKDQNKMMAEQGTTQKEQSQLLKDHSKMLEALEKDATRDDKAYEERGLKDESTWGALDKEALARIKVLVDGWKDLMNVSLIFIALFLTVVTAFISPIIQLFSTPSSTNSKPALPPTSLQLVALFYYLALMFSICNSVMCVLGLQWAGRLLSSPLGRTNLERALNRERRKVLAEQRLLPLMGVLFWTLLLSIAFFVIGFLIQFWALSFSFDERTPILIIGAIAATALAITILGVILATTYHATVHKNSPFESPLSSASVATWAWLKRVMKKPENESKKEKGGSRRWYQHEVTIRYLDMLRHRVQRFSRLIASELSLSLGPLSHQSSRNVGELLDDLQSEMRKETPIELLMTEDEDDSETVQALKAFARLVIGTNDAEVLERAVPSFDLGEWCKSGGDLLPVFVAVRERFLATDTSFRVKETIYKQLAYCRQWRGWTDYRAWRRDLEGNAITRWCRNQCLDLVYQSHKSHRRFFSAFVFLVSLEEGNKDLRGDPDDESYERIIARVLSSFDRDGELGDRYDVFRSAVNECNSLLRDGRSDDVIRILSGSDQASILRSLLRNPSLNWYEIEDIIGLIVRGKETTVLGKLARFCYNIPDIKPVRGELLLIDFLGSLIRSLPSTFTLSQSFGLAPTLVLLLRYHARINSSVLSRYSDTLVYFLDHGGFEALPCLRPADDFFQLCLTLSPDDTVQSTNYQERARFYLERHGALVALPPPSPEELQRLIDALQSYQHNWASQDLEESFADAIIECDSLCQEGTRAQLKTLLSHVDRVPLLSLVLQNPRFSGQHISALVPLIVEGNEPEHIRAAPDLITDVSLMARSNGHLPILAFLTTLIPFLPPDYVVPTGFDLSQTLKLFMDNYPNQHSWRKHSDTLMHYLHRGALDALSDQNSVREFLDTCIRAFRWMDDWNEDQQTSTLTRERAVKLKRKLEELDYARCRARQSLIASRVLDEPPDPPTTEEAVYPWSSALPTDNTLRTRLTDFWRWKWRGLTAAAVSDVEKALRQSVT
ncbi:hypothetical protein SISNIDRAFT_491632 [Sistotremastrum niveocremeum HHB9708]|uniref:DUF6535 domain-containing protein n=1 Tax=Sistotremastrum niveocremeum HHB9708 TaxID=1314777 RepID=A0A164MK18_9AGAM|nr:hypothetical protein SISNIDRAFT_491632 [Sistotremastrum niveocremeum HHB9708]